MSRAEPKKDYLRITVMYISRCDYKKSFKNNKKTNLFTVREARRKKRKSKK